MEPKDKSSDKFVVMLFSIFLYIALMFIVLHIVQMQAEDPSLTFFTAFLAVNDHISKRPFDISLASPESVKAFLIFTGLYALVAVYLYTEQQNKDFASSQTSDGSAKWNTDFAGFKKQFTAPESIPGNPEAGNPNLIYGQKVLYHLHDAGGKAINLNTLIVGSSGSGKSFGLIKPNLMQMNSSFVITDPSGEIFRAQAKMLQEHGYVVKLLSTSDMTHSCCYNPFDYVYDEDGNLDESKVSTMITMFMANASGMQEAGKKSGDPFWDKASHALLSACAMMLLEFFPKEDHNMFNMLRLVQQGKVSEQPTPGEQTKLDQKFEKCRKQNSSAHCFSSWDTFKLAPARTANSILISAGVDLNWFNETRVHNFTTTDYKVKTRNLAGEIIEYARDENGQLIPTDKNVNLHTIGDERTALFINTPSANGTYNFLISMFYAQLFDIIYGRAEKLCENKYMICNDLTNLVDKHGRVLTPAQIEKNKERKAEEAKKEAERSQDSKHASKKKEADVTPKWGTPIVTMIDTREDAEKILELYRTSKIEHTTEYGKDVYYIYNENADKKYSLPGYPAGYMKKVYSEKVGQDFLNQFNHCGIKKQSASLPWHVTCLLDEFSNIGRIPDFPEKLATMRKFEISCMIVLQSKSQLDAAYDKKANDIISNCVCKIFLGSTDVDTCEWFSKMLGKQTIKIRTVSRNRSSKGGSTNEGAQVKGRELAMPDELARMPKKKCVVMIEGCNPFFVNKYKATDHPRWKETGDGTSANNTPLDSYIYCMNKELADNSEAKSMSEMLVCELNKKPDISNVQSKEALLNALRAKNTQEAAAKTKAPAQVQRQTPTNSIDTDDGTSDMDDIMNDAEQTTVQSQRVPGSHSYRYGGSNGRPKTGTGRTTTKSQKKYNNP